jgi:beta-lactam-binding protein with PASTA domain
MDSGKIRSFLSFVFSKLFLKNVFLAIGIFILISILFFFSLRFYTNHGESVEVPNLKEKKLEDAVKILNDLDLEYEVVDSTYLPGKPAGVVLEQIPAPTEKIKRYRKVFLTINSYSKPLITLPDVRDLSYRNAKATLESVGLQVVKVEYVPSEYKDLVKDVKKGRFVLAPGARVQEGSQLTLVVGGSQGETEEIDCPSFHSLTYEKAIQQANSDSLNISSAEFDIQPKNRADSSLFFVYKQFPLKGSPIAIGGSVKIFLTKDKSLLSEPEEEFKELNEDSVKKVQNKKDIEKFF